MSDSPKPPVPSVKDLTGLNEFDLTPSEGSAEGPPPDFAIDLTPDAPAEISSHDEFASPLMPDFSQPESAPAEGGESPMSLEASPAETADFNDFAMAMEPSTEALPEPAADLGDSGLDLSGLELDAETPPQPEPTAPTKTAAAPQATAATALTATAATSATATIAAPSSGTQTSTRAPLEKIRELSEQSAAAAPNVEAAFPFSLLIEGQLNEHDKTRILDLLSREQMGVREVDLEHQFTAGRVLIPRISEFAGILLVQALRGTQARMRLGPSDQIFATQDTRAEAGEPGFNSPHEPFAPHSPVTGATRANLETSLHPAEKIPVTTDSFLPELPDFQVIDVVIATTSVEARIVDRRESEFQEILDSLQSELKFKAHRKGARALVRFKMDIAPLSLSSGYRVTVSATAVKPSVI